LAVIASPLISGNCLPCVHSYHPCQYVTLSLVCDECHAVGVLGVFPAEAADYGLDYKKELARRRRKIPESEFQDGPEGLK